jgi:hypothetical protein
MHLLEMGPGHRRSVARMPTGRTLRECMQLHDRQAKEPKAQHAEGHHDFDQGETVRGTQ